MLAYSRDQLFALRKSQQPSVAVRRAYAAVVRPRGSRAGRNLHRVRAMSQRQASQLITTKSADCERSCTPSLQHPATKTLRSQGSESIQRPTAVPGGKKLVITAPSLYVLNAASLAKQHAIEHLTAELTSHDADIAVITETHFKGKHKDGAAGIPGFTLYRRDRLGRRGGGVALYVRSSLQSAVWQSAHNDPRMELLWVTAGGVIIGALYHPPKPKYTQQAMLDYVETCIEELNASFPGATVILAGDMNSLSDQEIIECTGLTPIVYQPTRGANILDRIYVTCPMTYATVRVIKSVVRSDHKAVVAYAERSTGERSKTKITRIYRRRTPAQHARFLKHISTMDMDNIQHTTDTQTEFDNFYTTVLDLLNRFYPERKITITSADPEYMTPEIKSMLRKKNRLMRSGRLEEADALARRIGTEITRRNTIRFSRLQGKVNSKDVWNAVRQVTGRAQTTPAVDGITAESLNKYYADISTDSDYHSPAIKNSASSNQQSYVSEWQVFKILDSLRPTATGLDQLPAWFLRLGAPVFYKPVTRLLNLSLSTSVTPLQWKRANIKPIPKINSPSQHSDFRPISITPVLTRIMERTVVQHFLYPAYQSPPPTLTFSDQYAFRPTGSPAAAIISILHSITELLENNQFVVVYALDFSKAFDTVRHSTLLEKLAMLDIPDHVYNWLVNFFSGHSHCTYYNDMQSSFEEITASIIQGSGIGPAAYVVNAADLQPKDSRNRICKFADDTYLIIGASAIDTRIQELDNIEIWAKSNNLKLNRAKSMELVCVDTRRKINIQLPSPIPGIKRAESIKILGVTITNHLTVTSHVQDVISSSAQTLYALKTLRAHGMNNQLLQQIYKSVIIAKLQYASSAWWGFTKSTDRQKIDKFIARSVKSGFCPQDLNTFTELCEKADDKLFEQILCNTYHVLYQFLPPPSVASQNYDLRPRKHDKQLPDRTTRLSDCNFITRMLYQDIY